jgi:Seven in absentia protein family
MEGVICLNKAVKECLECPVCAQFFTPPILECMSGHSICGKCSLKVNNCPECRLHILPSRNWSLERIISSIEIKCRFQGCDSKILLSRLQIHEKSCKFNPNYLCIIKGCEWEGIRIINHLVSIHKCKEFFIGSNDSVRGWNSKIWKNADWGYSVWNFNGKYVINQSFSDNRFFYLWIYDLGNQRLRLKLSIHNENQVVQYFVTTTPVNTSEKSIPFHLSVEHIEKYFLQTAEGFDHGYKRLSINIEIIDGGSTCN